MPRKSQGFSVILFIIGLSLVSFFGVIGFKVIPVYFEYYSVRQNLLALENETFNPHTIPLQVRRTLDKKFQIDDIKSVSVRDVKIDRVGGGYRVRVVYDVPVEITDHLTLKLHFDKSTVVKKNAG